MILYVQPLGDGGKEKLPFYRKKRWLNLLPLTGGAFIQPTYFYHFPAPISINNPY